ncbi:DEAD/DEAH box helicase [Falsibacillus pallidus]|uniref:SNF2 family DNA or RNA helicase n=1 Tax=Falsibacillus pallidus TaxID=493781 RepID=A0A370GCT6_9BACI|nr:DEAD/DEAH box helicase [Falsibacillus pallidus]RDI41635.1 SNF2 family DNA or RNA helicase [Falsibacillus pallidus]
MATNRLLSVELKKSNNGAYLMSVHNEDGDELYSRDWIPKLFLWHEESYFGTQFERSFSTELEVDSWSLLSLFGKESFNSLYKWEWDDLGELFLAASPVMLDAIQEGKWQPSFSEQEGSPLKWKLPQMVKDEFGEEFWMELFDMGMTAMDVAEEFFHHAVTDYVQKSADGSDLKAKLERLQNGPLTGSELALYFDEHRFSEWSGMGESELPFTMGLRLTEPEVDEEPWTLETVLRDRKNPDILIGVEEEGPFPKSWRTHLSEVDEEEERWIRLIPSLEDEDCQLRRELSEVEAWDFLTDTSEKLLQVGVEILLPSWWQAMQDEKFMLKAKVKSTNTSYRPSFVGLNAMLDFDWRLSMNGTEISEDDFHKMVEQQRRLIKVNGEWMKLDPDMIRRIQDLMKRAKQEGLRVQDLLQQEMGGMGEADEDEDFDPRAFAQVQIELNRSLRNMMTQLEDFSEIPSVMVSPNFEGTLRPYQHQGMSWMLFLREHGFGAILADDMGLGKTVQLITYLLHVKEHGNPASPALIIAPTSVLGNWQKELEKFAPTLKVMLHYGSNRAKGEEFVSRIADVDVVLTSFGISHLDFEDISEIEWSTIALDEAQNIKNAQTKQSRAIRKLRGQHHIALTGTPMENRLSELWSIFDFTNHGYLGTFGQFQKRFILPIERDDAKGKIQLLQRLIKPFLMRRTKKDPEVELNLPDKLEQKEYVPLTAEQASLYEQLVKDTFAQLETLSGFERRGLILQMLNRLKQLCNHPALFLKEADPRMILERSEKLEKLVDLVDALMEAGEACLIFTQYLAMGEMIRGILEKRLKLKIPFLNGSMPKAQRDEYVQRFQDGEFPIFLLSLKAGGTGLNLTAANHVIHYDRWWNPAVENQATDRAYRIGQKRFVHVHKMITTGTLEEKIDAMLEKKQALNDEIIQSDQWITELSNTDLRELLSLS